MSVILPGIIQLFSAQWYTYQPVKYFILFPKISCILLEFCTEVPQQGRLLPNVVKTSCWKNVKGWIVSLINQSNSKLKTEKLWPVPLDQWAWRWCTANLWLESPAQPNQKERKRKASHMLYKWLIRHAWSSRYDTTA